MRGPGSVPTGGNILSLDFYHIVKPVMPILPLLPILSICEKPEYINEKIILIHHETDSHRLLGRVMYNFLSDVFLVYPPKNNLLCFIIFLW